MVLHTGLLGLLTRSFVHAALYTGALGNVGIVVTNQRPGVQCSMITIDELLDDADDASLPQWRRIGSFNVLVSERGTAIIYGENERALLIYPDKVMLEVQGDMRNPLGRQIQAAFRHRPGPRIQTCFDDTPDEHGSVLDVLESVPEPEPEPEPRKWATIPITSGEVSD